MCEIMRNIQIYPENTRVHLDYQQTNETTRQWYARAKLEQHDRNVENQTRNFWRLPIAVSPFSERKAAERSTAYEA